MLLNEDALLFNDVRVYGTSGLSTWGLPRWATLVGDTTAMRD